MTINDLLESGGYLEGFLVIIKYNEDETQCLFEKTIDDGRSIPEKIRDMEIKYMYATTYNQKAGSVSAALIIEVE